MAKPVINDALWERVSKVLPAPKPRRFRFPGRKPLDDRSVLSGVLYVLKSGIPWDALPQEMGSGSGMSCWNRLAYWQQSGAWPKIEETLKGHLPDSHQYDWSRAIVGRRSRRKRKGKKMGPRIADRRSAHECALPLVNRNSSWLVENQAGRSAFPSTAI